MITYMLLHMLIRQGAHSHSSQTSPPQQAPTLSCAQCISWSTPGIAKLVSTTNSWWRKRNTAWQCKTAFKTAMTQAPSFSLVSCHAAAAMIRICRSGVAPATKLWRSEQTWQLELTSSCSSNSSKANCTNGSVFVWRHTGVVQCLLQDEFVIMSGLCTFSAHVCTGCVVLGDTQMSNAMQMHVHACHTQTHTDAYLSKVLVLHRDKA